MTGDTRDEMAEIRLGIDAAELCGFDDGVECGGSFTASIGTGEGPVFASDGQRADGTFGGIVADVETTVGGIACQRFPAREGIPDGVRQRTLAADFAQGRLELNLQGLYQLAPNV